MSSSSGRARPAVPQGFGHVRGRPEELQACTSGPWGASACAGPG